MAISSLKKRFLASLGMTDQLFNAFFNNGNIRIFNQSSLINVGHIVHYVGHIVRLQGRMLCKNNPHHSVQFVLLNETNQFTNHPFRKEFGCIDAIRRYRLHELIDTGQPALFPILKKINIKFGV